ncbi:MAG TPA: hypothetical protein VN668_16190 [Stellaceae bacterium]|nr:hypothetical protein [Stellaceae bacterium]
MFRTILLASIGLALSIVPGAARAAEPHYLPDPMATPGALNAMVTQQNIGTTICRRGWTRSIRPPERYTEPLKRRLLYSPGSPYFDPGARLREFELDHRVPLGLGGAPSDRKNLWDEPRFGLWSARRKDELEGLIQGFVCRGRLTLAQGQAAFLGDWTRAYRRYLGEPAWQGDTGTTDPLATPETRARSHDDGPPPLPPLPANKPAVAAAPHCAFAWSPTGPGRGPWFFKRCP